MPADPYKYFRLEARELIEQLTAGILELERGGGAAVAQRLLRVAHTLKGAARVVRQTDIANLAHALEETLAPYRETTDPIPGDCTRASFALVDKISAGVARLDVAPAPEVIAPAQPAAPPAPRVSPRADVADVDALLDGIGEIHARASTLRGLGPELGQLRHLAELLRAQLAPRPRTAFDPHKARELVRQLHERLMRSERTFETGLDHMTRELLQVRDAAEQLRLAPAATLFTALERTVRDAARELGKDVTFEGRGGEVRVDGQVLASIVGALVQLARNAVAHGIELPADRAAAGKPPSGRVIIEVARRGRKVVFTCRDDGRGVDLEAVRAVARQRGLPAEARDANELVQILLRGGITTSSQITAVAGRGIGLDIVRDVTDSLAGDVAVQTGPTGTTFELSLPASLTSIEAVASAGASAAIPIMAVRRTMHVTSSEVSRTARGESVLVDGQAVPFLRLASALRLDDARRRTSWTVLVIEHDGRAAALGVDRLASTASIIVRALPDLAAADPVVAGAAFDADATPQLVLDPDRLIALAHSEHAVPEQRELVRPSVLVIDDSLTTRMLEQRILESAGYDVDTAVSGEHGLEAARRKRYALFLVDVEMPGIDGFTFIERVRADPMLRDTPAILVTSRASAEDRRRGEEVGAQGYIVKGEFDQVDLLARIERMVRS